MKNIDKYVAVMFPYPSGDGLHIGHTYNYAIMDSYCRYLRHKGIEVFQPFGYDAFGLPAENYARKMNRDPKDITYENIDKFRSQMGRMDTQYQELLITSDPSYQKWTQWLFLKLKEHGLAYKKYGDVNWCHSCETVLAREQVKDGKCDRCSSEIEIKQMDQWYFKISDYAERLLKNLDWIDYPTPTKNAQKAWIGKSEGFEIDFEIRRDIKLFPQDFETNEKISVFTTKPETLFNVKFISVSKSSKFANKSKDGEYFTGEYAICPVSNTEIPIWVADYVVDGYGTGYVMGVPGDDKRDTDFAIRNNITFSESRENFDFIPDKLIKLSMGRKKINYKLHDWCVSRQRKWGCPIPIDGETDTLDTFVDSSFYFIRYCDPNNVEELCNKSRYKQVDLYVGGNEHACMHLIYARFINMFLYDIGITNEEEPFKKVIHQGMILNNNEKMSKTKGNTIDPNNYDSDELRFYLMFIGHYFDGGSWSDKNIVGIRRFIFRFKEWVSREGSDTFDIESFREKIDAFAESFKFNKVVSEFMTLVNKERNKNITSESKEKMISILEIYMPGIRTKLK